MPSFRVSPEIVEIRLQSVIEDRGGRVHGMHASDARPLRSSRPGDRRADATASATRAVHRRESADRELLGLLCQAGVDGEQRVEHLAPFRLP
jgi:hypothetical protein